MKWSAIFLILISSILLVQKVSGQQGANQKISIKNFKLLENEANFFTGKKGLKCEVDVYFSEVIDDFMSQRYKITWRLEDAVGKVLFDSKKASSSHDKNTSASATAPFGKYDVSYAADEGVHLFIAYNELDLPNGQNSCKLILSAEHKTKNFPDFWSKDISFAFKKIAIQSFEKQVFTVKNVMFENYTGLNSQRLNINYDIHIAYGASEVEEKNYSLFWQLLNEAGEEVLNSEASIHTKNKKLYLSSFDKVSTGGYENDDVVHIDYKTITLSGKQNVTFMMYVVHEGQKKQIHEEKAIVNLLELHSFDKQEFTMKNLKAIASEQNGTAGLKVSFDCKFKYNRIASEGAGYDFYFYIKMNLNQGEIYSPSEKKPYKTKGEYVRVNYADLSSKTTEEYHSRTLFIPYFFLDTKQFDCNASLSLHVTNQDGSVTFSELGNTTVHFTKSKTVTANFTLSALTLVKKNYDAAIGNNFEKRKPDPQWFIKTGDFYLYIGDVNYNDYEAFEDEVILKFTEGEELWFIIIDHDNGFNPNDVLERIKIPSATKLVEVHDFHKGDIEKLTYTFRIQD